MASNITKTPSYLIQYMEYDKKIEYPVEMQWREIIVDGLFCPYPQHRFSLGCLRNFRRKPETLQLLTRIGLGLKFEKNEGNWFTVENQCEIPVFILLRKTTDQIKLQPSIVTNLNP